MLDIKCFLCRVPNDLKNLYFRMLPLHHIKNEVKTDLSLAILCLFTSGLHEPRCLLQRVTSGGYVDYTF